MRAGNGTDWTGTTGRVTITPTTIALRDFRTASRDGSLAIAGTFARAGANAGDLDAKVDARGIALAAVNRDYVGTLGAHVEVARKREPAVVEAGDVTVDGTQLARSKTAPPTTLSLKISARPEHVTVAASVKALPIGGVAFALDLAAPARLEDVAAWKRAGRRAIRSAQLTVQGVDVAKLATFTGLPITAGKLAGTIALTATTATGSIKLSNVQSPKLRGIDHVDTDLELAQTADDELTPTLTVTAANLGRVVAQAHVGLPLRTLDPAAWRAIGLRAMRGATIKTDNIVVDPAMLARFDITATLRGNVQAEVDIGEALRTVAVHAAPRRTSARGTPIAQPVDVHVDADDRRQTPRPRRSRCSRRARRSRSCR